MKKLALISLALLCALCFAVAAYAATKTLSVSMKGGSSETPKGDPNGKGTAKFTLNTSTGRVCFKLTWSAIGNPVAAHIHKGKKGVAGPVVIPLFGGTPKHSGCVKASKALVKSIAKSPSQYYVNVHTQAFPGGAIRAQL